MTHEDYTVRQADMMILDANVSLPNASNLIFYPPDYNAATSIWAGGRSIREYDPTPEQIVDWARSAGTE